MAQCISLGTWKRITTPIHYVYISDTIWVPCIPMRTRNFNAYPELHKHAHSLLVYSHVIWVHAQH